MLFWAIFHFVCSSVVFFFPAQARALYKLYSNVIFVLSLYNVMLEMIKQHCIGMVTAQLPFKTDVGKRPR